ncbi:hypothetical protein KZZ52_56275 [Dactylosporangium sp. AC04546]|uniref:hypothetical protein n=1 Tax=Dactylosporangium sp. AC04546 TaxID=2862460 RepID=UPI001EE05BBB|nr:hypothetical protein [Dactylosporangium sp. AC04546]WVK83175.1 hypothetical protein KZZ52_56275 [Dactylosporangium sp. AC04546]
MTSGNEQRRKRRSDSFRRDEADEADNWLAGLRGSGRGEPDPFSAPPPPEPAPFEHPAFDAPPPPPPPPRARRRPRDEPGDSPSGVFSPAMLPPAPPPSRPPAIDSTQAIGRRRRDDSGESPSGSFRATPPADPGAAAPGGRRRAREIEPPARPSESYDHGPELTPIIKPLADYTPAQPSAEPPPLVPIFPSMRPDAPPDAPPAGRRGRRAAEEAPRDHEPGGRRRAREDTGPPTGDIAARRGFGSTGDVADRRSAPTGDVVDRRSASTGDAADRRFGSTGDVTDRRFAEPPAGDAPGRRFGSEGDAADRRFGSTGDAADRRFGSPGDAAGRRFAEPGTGDVGGRRRRDGTGEFPGEFGGRRDGTGEPGGRRDGSGEFGGRRNGTGELGGRRGRADETTAFRRERQDEFGGPRRYDDEPSAGPRGRMASAGFAASAPPDVDAPRRRPSFDDPPHQRRALDDAMPGRGYDDPPPARRRGTGEFTGSGARALRDRPGAPGRPPARPGRGGTGTHPRPATMESPHRPHRWVAMLSAIAVLVVLAACGIGTWFIFRDERDGPESARSSTTDGPKKRDISSRKVDPNPLTEAEVFPSNNIVAVPNEPPYLILSTKASPDCKTAATDDLAALLMNAGCSEVVRATMKSPNEEYLITAGLFNLDTEEAAAKAFDAVKPIVDGQKGRFSGMSVGAGTGTDALVRAPTQLGWNFKGHFIAYCVIARVDGNAFAPDDPYPNQITFDIVETYLENGIIGNRAIIQPEATPAASLPASGGSQPPPS